MELKWPPSTIFHHVFRFPYFLVFAPTSHPNTSQLQTTQLQRHGTWILFFCSFSQRVMCLVQATIGVKRGKGSRNQKTGSGSSVLFSNLLRGAKKGRRACTTRYSQTWKCYVSDTTKVLSCACRDGETRKNCAPRSVAAFQKGIRFLSVIHSPKFAKVSSWNGSKNFTTTNKW